MVSLVPVDAERLRNAIQELSSASERLSVQLHLARRKAAIEPPKAGELENGKPEFGWRKIGDAMRLQLVDFWRWHDRTLSSMNSLLPVTTALLDNLDRPGWVPRLRRTVDRLANWHNFPDRNGDHEIDVVPLVTRLIWGDPPDWSVCYRELSKAQEDIVCLRSSARINPEDARKRLTAALEAAAVSVETYPPVLWERIAEAEDGLNSSTVNGLAATLGYGPIIEEFARPNPGFRDSRYIRFSKASGGVLEVIHWAQHDIVGMERAKRDVATKMIPGILREWIEKVRTPVPKFTNTPAVECVPADATPQEVEYKAAIAKLKIPPELEKKFSGTQKRAVILLHWKLAGGPGVGPARVSDQWNSSGFKPTIDKSKLNTIKSSIARMQKLLGKTTSGPKKKGTPRKK